jgi:signal transduction histidine kinase
MKLPASKSWIVSLSLFAAAVLIFSSLVFVQLSLIDTSKAGLFILSAFCLATIGGLLGMSLAVKEMKRRERTRTMKAKARQHDQRESLLTIINGTNQAIFTVNSRGIIRVYNAALLSLLDTNQSLSGKRVDDVMSLHDQNGEPVSLFTLMKSTPRFERDDLSFQFSEGDSIRLHLSVNKIQSAFSSHRQMDDEGYVCIARDVTKQKSLEEERDEFISVVSHELRTPVTIAEGTISNVQYFVENGSDPKKLVPSLKEAHDQIVLLANMINDLGTLSRAERGAGDAQEPIAIKALVESLYKKYESSAAKKGLALNIELGHGLGEVTTSRLYLEELLQNLITNAIKYTTDGSVTLAAHRKPAGIEFAVKDTGIGISKTDLKHIFDKFYRSEDYRTRETAGTGLGLYVASKLMRKLDTKIDVHSRLNHGSTFEFILADQQPKRKA